LREGYSAVDLRRDLLAGLVVGVVALPLAMALAIAVGAPPQQGLYTSIVAGFVIALLGGSRTQVSGPTAAFIVILAPIVARHGIGGLLISGVIGGLILMLMGFARLGRFIEFIPHPVTTGFTAGIATVIATLQIKDLLGLQLARTPDHFLERVGAMFSARGTLSAGDLAVGLSTLALLMAAPRITKKVPPAILALPIAGLLTWALGRLVPGLSVATIASRFQNRVGDTVVHGIPRLPPLPMWPWSAAGADGHTFSIGFATIRELAPSGFAIAMLGAIESLLSAVVADGMAGTRHDPDAELLAQGAGNVIAPFFGGIPATGAIARTATNIRSGARSPVASVVHALTVLAAVLLLAPIIGYLPMAGLAALLLLVAWNMSEAKHFVHIVRVAPRSDVLVLLTCFGLTVFFDMVISVTAGVMLAALLFMRRMAEVTHAKLYEGTAEGITRPLPPGVVTYDIAGPLFFGAAQRAMGTLRLASERASVVVFRLDHVPAMDATGLVALESALGALQKQGVAAVLVGLQRQPAGVVERAHLADRYAGLKIYKTLDDALSTLPAADGAS
jgi:SulP family sulfate permease